MNTRKLWTTGIAVMLMTAFMVGCKDENVETVGVCPLVVSTNPANLATNVPLDQVVTVTFNEAMDPATITPEALTLLSPGSPGGRSRATQISGDMTYDAATYTMRFVPSSRLAPSATYTGTVATTVKDLMGNALQVDYVWTFSTRALIVPTVVSTDPANNSLNLVLNKTVTATFSVPMDPLTVNATTFTLRQGSTPIAGTISYSESTASFKPSTNLAVGNVYTATITTGAKTTEGVALASNYVWTFNSNAAAGPGAVNLGTSDRFGILAGVGVSNNAGPSQINDLDVGIYPGNRSSITGFFDVDGGPGQINNGAFFAADDVAPAGTNAMLNQAQLDLVAAYDEAAGANMPAPQVAPADLGGQTLAPGIWTSASTLLLQNGNLTLDAQGDPNAVWIFQIGSAFTSVGSGPFPSASGGNVILAGGAQAKNVFWQVGSSAIIGDFTSFKGNVLAFSSITMNTGANAEGRMLARNGSVVMTSNNIINKP